MRAAGSKQRSVVMRATVEYVRLVPADQDPATIEEYTNDLNQCGSATIFRLSDIQEQMDRRFTDHDAEDYDDLPGASCFCAYAHEEFVREATEHDEAVFGIRVLDGQELALPDESVSAEKQAEA